MALANTLHLSLTIPPPTTHNTDTCTQTTHFFNLTDFLKYWMIHMPQMQIAQVHVRSRTKSLKSKLFKSLSPQLHSAPKSHYSLVGRPVCQSNDLETKPFNFTLGSCGASGTPTHRSTCPQGPQVRLVMNSRSPSQSFSYSYPVSLHCPISTKTKTITQLCFATNSWVTFIYVGISEDRLGTWFQKERFVESDS